MGRPTRKRPRRSSGINWSLELNVYCIAMRVLFLAALVLAANAVDVEDVAEVHELNGDLVPHPVGDCLRA